MSQRDAEIWVRARCARDKLIERYSHHPDVTGVDIGYAPERAAETEGIVLRIYVRERWAEASPETRVAFPERVEGFAVVVTPRESRLQADALTASEESNHPR